MMQLNGRISSQADTWPNPITFLWSKVSGPGPVTFSTPTQLSTGADFTVPGIYKLRMTATDGKFSAFDDAVVTVVAANHPIVDAGPDQTITEPIDTANMVATATDPQGEALTLLWTFISGPAQPTISNASVLRPVMTFFGVTGTYVFSLTAANSKHSTVDSVTITVQ